MKIIVGIMVLLGALSLAAMLKVGLLGWVAILGIAVFLITKVAK